MMNITKVNVFYVFMSSIFFLYLYVIPLPFIGNTSNLFPLILLPFALIYSPDYLNRIWINKSFLFILSLLLIYAYLSTASTMLHGEYDFGSIKTIFNIVYSIVGITSFVAIFTRKYQTNDSIVGVLKFSLYLQCFFIVLMLYSPSISEIIQAITKSDESIELMEQYGGVRGLGFTSFAAFGFSVILSFLIIFVYSYKFMQDKKQIKSIIFLCCISIISLSAGRTIIASFFIMFIVFLILNPKYIAVSFITICLLLIFIYYLIVSDPFESGSTLWYYSRYVLQGFYSYIETGVFSYSSTERLFEMYFVPDELTILLGDGLYTGEDGKFYMHTDSGFMRLLLLGGLPLSVFVYSVFLYMCFTLNKYMKGHIPISVLIVTVYLILSITLHYKGEVILFNVAGMKIYFMLLSFYILKTTIEDSENSIKLKA